MENINDLLRLVIWRNVKGEIRLFNTLIVSAWHLYENNLLMAG